MTSTQFAMMAAFYFSLMSEIKTVQGKRRAARFYDWIAAGFMVVAIVSIIGE